MTVSPERVLALDCGTHAVRVLAFDPATGDHRLLAERDLPLQHAGPHAVHIDPRTLADATLATVRTAIDSCAREGHTVTALSVTNMRETALTWSRSSGKPLAPGVMWMSQESRPVVERWRAAGYDRLIRERTGLTNDPFFFGSKLAWLLEQDDGVADAAATGDLAVGTVDSFLLHVLTDGAIHATDASNASRTQLMDIGSGSWSAELCETLGVPQHCLPAISPSATWFGTTDAAACGASVPIAGVIADQQASLLGHGCESAGQVKATLGTSGVVCAQLGRERADGAGLLTSISWHAPDGTIQYELEGSAFHCGYTNNWINDRIAGARDVPRDARLGPAPSAGDRVYLLPAFTGLGAPRWPSGRGAALIGLGMDTRPEDIVRAGLESMAYQIHDLLQAVIAHIGPVNALNVDGGGARSDYVCSMLADLTGLQVIRPGLCELTSAGAAIAGLRGINRASEGGSFVTAAGAARFEPGASHYAQDGYARWADLVHRVLEGTQEDSTP